MSSSTIWGKAKGFTLVEILISLVILSMLVTLAGTAYSVYIDRWKDNLGDFEQQLSETRATMLVDEALQNVFPFVVDTEQVENAALNASFFFFGDGNRIEGVTGSGIFNYANAGIFKLELQGRKVIYFERSTADILLEQPNQSFMYTRKLIYLDNVENISFRYFGWPSFEVMLEEASENQPTDKRQWYSTYNSVERGLLPEIIELTVTSGQQQWTVEFDVPEGSKQLLGKYLNES